MLAIGRYTLRYAGNDLSAISGMAWRGALGYALKRTVCVMRLNHCKTCLLYRGCAYAYVFETPVPPSAKQLQGYPFAPHPFVLGQGQTTADGHYDLPLYLFGEGNRHLPYLIEALARAGERGLGKERLTLILESVWQDRPDDEPLCLYRPGEVLQDHYPFEELPPAMPGQILLRFLTPLRLRHQNDLITPSNFSFAEFFRALLRRLSLLSYFHGQKPMQADFKGLIQAAKAIKPINAQLFWQEQSRFSTRQKTRIHMGGIIGKLTFATKDMAAFWPYLWVGQFTHVGKGASMGLGQYRIEEASRTEQGGLHAAPLPLQGVA